MKSKLRATHEIACDVLVAGGGIAGVCCAVSAARHGAKVILCQDRAVLGGNASSEIRMHICGADMSGSRGTMLEVEAREGGIVEEIRLENAVRNPQRSWSMMDLILYEKCVAEPGLELMLDTTVTAAEVSGRTIAAVQAVRESTEDEFIIKAKIFIDCTGDGRLAAEAGAGYRVGREAKSEYGESLALEEPDTRSLGMSLLFEAEDMGRAVRFVAPPWIRNFTEDELELREHLTYDYGYWWVEWGGCSDTIKETHTIRHELLRIMLGVWNHIKNTGQHGADSFALTWFGFLPGKRESRRFKGLHTLTEIDIVQAPHFDDAIAFGGWSLDTHPPEGIDAVDEDPCHQPAPPYLYQIPLRCCLSADIDNLMFAGRHISASHIAFASTRVMATCGVIGQGVGTAAALAVKEHLSPSQLPESKEAMKSIQDNLLADDCFLPGIEVRKRDHAVTAAITASSEIPGAPAGNAVTTLTRSVFGEGGVHPRYDSGSTNRWISESLPAWLTLEWRDEIELAEIRVVFDTGMHRFLTLMSRKLGESYEKTMTWGPQPETVRDYAIEYDDAGSWKILAEVTGNFQRLRIHRFDPIRTRMIRISISATNGITQARICQMRCYADGE